uniref:Uncharacterized protein n=1 Tax=Micrurus corallinus TaxID=54390 RepID=A0A2D4ET74_MICCO
MFKNLDFIILLSILFTLISITSVFNLIISHSAYLNGKKYLTQAFSVIVCSTANIDKRRNSRELSEEERKKAIESMVTSKATKPSPQSFMFLGPQSLMLSKRP